MKVKSATGGLQTAAQENTVWSEELIRVQSVRASGARAWGALISVLLWVCLATAQDVPSNPLANPGARVGSAPPPTATTNPSPPPPPPTVSLPAPGAITSFSGMIVRSVELRGLTADQRVLTSLHNLIAQKENQPLDREKIRQSLIALYSTGRFSDVQAEAERNNSRDLTLVFQAVPNYFVGSLAASGAPKRPNNNQVVDASKLRLGEAITPAKIDSAIRRIRQVLQDNGYYRTEVTEAETRHPQTELADVYFHVVVREPAHIGKVIVQGSAGFSADEVAEISGLEQGHTVTAQRLLRAIARLRKKYSKQNRLESQIALVDKPYHADTNTVDYVFEINRGPTVSVTTAGTKIGKGKLRKYVPVFEEHAVDEDLLNEGRRNLSDYLQTEGYFDAKVDFAQQNEAASDHLHVIYTIDRGVRHEVAAVAVSGNKYFSTDDLRERMQVQPKNWILSHGRFNQTLLAQDADNITNLYRANGFEQVKVETSTKDDYEGRLGDMGVFFVITEGPQTRVGNVKIDGNQKVSSDQLRALMTTLEGEPYSEANVSRDRDTVMSYYFNRGFPNAQFEASSTKTGDTTVDVTYRISEGQQFFVDRVLSSQLQYTRPYLVRRQFQIHPGDPLGQDALNTTQTRLYDLGVFNEVRLAVQNPDGESAYKDVLLQFSEAKRWTFNYGIGMEAGTGQPLGTTKVTNPGSGNAFVGVVSPEGTTGVSPRVSFDVTRINFRGRAHTLSLSTHVSTLTQRALLSFDAPRWFDNPSLRITFNALYDNTVNTTTFTSQRLEGSVQVEHVRSRITTLMYRYTYREVKATNVVVSPELIALYQQPVRVGIPSLTYIRDKRNDPLNASSGNYTTVDAGLAATYFGSQVNFGRVQAQNATYHPFGKRDRPWVFARNTRVGTSSPFGSCPKVTSTNTLPGGQICQALSNGTQQPLIPLPERFLAGGTNTLRGFALNQAGPRDPDFGTPLGGNAMVINNLEIRTPATALPYLGDNFSFVFFHDAGNVFDTTTDMIHSLFRWYQPGRDLCGIKASQSQCGYNYMTQAVGTGVRYLTPIGPVRVDFGYNLSAPRYGYTDQTGLFRGATTRRFNFYFSIGQAF